MKDVFKPILLVICIVSSVLNVTAQDIPPGITLNFSSVCCGPPDGKAVFDYIKIFKSKNHIAKIRTMLISPLGPEGEHAYVLDLTGFTALQKKHFTTGIEKAINASKSKSPSDGYISVNDNKHQWHLINIIKKKNEYERKGLTIKSVDL